MNSPSAQHLIDILLPLIGYWEYAEDIIAEIRKWNVSDADIDELTTVIWKTLHQAKEEQQIIEMTLAYESSKFWKQQEIKEHNATTQDMDTTLNALGNL